MIDKMQERDPQIERELEELVGVLVNIVPQLTEVRIFGSYNNGNWNPKTSDIDVFVETGDESYSKYERSFKKRIDVKDKIRQNIESNCEDFLRFSINLFTVEDVRKDSGNIGYAGNFILAAKSGRLIHPSKQNQAVN